MIAQATVLAVALLAQLPEGHPPLGSQNANAAPAQQAPAVPLPEDHPPMSGRPAPSAAELLEQLDATPGLKEREKSFDVAFALAKLYYSQGRFDDAALFFSQALEQAEPARAIALKHSRVKPKATPNPHCTEPSTSVERLIELARAAEQAKDVPGAVACARAAVSLLHDARVLRASALYLSGDAVTAITELSRVLDLDPDRADALFARGAIVAEASPDDVASLRRAKKDFDRYVKLNQESWRQPRAEKWVARLDRAIAAGGFSKMEPIPAPTAAPSKTPPPIMAEAGATAPSPAATAPAGGAPPKLSDEMIAAFNNTERTPEMEAQFDKLLDEGEKHLAAHDFEKARANYRQVMPFRPSDGRVRAGLAWSLIGAGAPMGENIFRVAADSNPSAVERLGDVLKANGDVEGAKKIWTKLAETAPGYAPKLQAKLGQ